MRRSFRTSRLLPFVVAAACVAAPACAGELGFTASAGADFLRWSEDIRPTPVEEHGPLAVFGLAWLQPSGTVRFGYRGRVYAGGVDYRGTQLFPPHLAATGTSRYDGMTHEGQLRVRIRGMLDAFGGIGYEVWKRRLSTHQQEDFTITALRLGLETGASQRVGWSAAVGLACPTGMSVETHLNSLGFDQNPTLDLRAHVGGYGRAGYRLASGWSISGSLESIRFDPSREVALTLDGEPQGSARQPGGRRRLAGISVGYGF